MINFSGIVYSIGIECGSTFILGVICLLLAKPWKKGTKDKAFWPSLISIAYSIILCIYFVSRIFIADVSSYKGVFQESHHDAGGGFAANEFVFWNGIGKKPVFHLDSLSKKKIYPLDFETGREYTIYFEKSTKTIVRVEENEP